MIKRWDVDQIVGPCEILEIDFWWPEIPTIDYDAIAKRRLEDQLKSRQERWKNYTWCTQARWERKLEKARSRVCK